MEDRRFDDLVKGRAQGRTRRSLIKGLLGLGGVAAAGAILRDTDAARRGFNGPPTAIPTLPPLPTQPPTPTRTPEPAVSCSGVLCADGCCDGACTATGACCPAGSTVCGPDCCPDGQAECCDNECCFGTCYGEELCCPSPQPVCTVDGCCDGQCVGLGQFCCAVEHVCGDTCCEESERCCSPSGGVFLCIPANNCCTDDDCIGAHCIEGECVPFTPTNTPTDTPTNTPIPPTNTPTDTPTNTPIPPTNTPTDTPTDTPTNTPVPLTGTANVTPGGGGCFTGGTRIAMADGTSRAIESMAVGHAVLGADGQINRVEAIETPLLHDRPLYALNDSAFFVTASHPFLTDDGWKSIDPDATAREHGAMRVGRLQVGNHLRVLSGVLVPVGGGFGGSEPIEVKVEPVLLESIAPVTAPSETRLYNLRLDGNQTYFANDLLVHNK